MAVCLIKNGLPRLLRKLAMTMTATFRNDDDGSISQ
jgi:hypothetical protein